MADLRQAAAGAPVTFHDGFERDRAGGVYGGLDVLVVPSLWPENSPLVIHEAFMHGLPVVGARVGGVPGLVQHGVDGLLYDPFSTESLRACLQRLIDDRALVETLAAGAPGVKSIDEDAREWDARYRQVSGRSAAPRRGGAAMTPPRVSIVIPTLNAGATLGEVLAAIAGQDGEFRPQIVAIDSGSTDGTLTRLREAGATVLTVPGGAFNHGETRNQALAQATGEFAVLLVQDAVPVSRGWLSALLDPLLRDPLGRRHVRAAGAIRACQPRDRALPRAVGRRAAPAALGRSVDT